MESDNPNEVRAPGFNERQEWTDEKIEQLKRLVRSGLTYTQIGKRMGYTRNAVIGKAHRLKIFRGHAKPRIATPPKRVYKQADGKFAPKPFIPVLKGDHKYRKLHQHSETHRYIKLLDLEPDHCRFPRGEDQDVTFCGNPRVDGYSYCKDCVEIAYKRDE